MKHLAPTQMRFFVGIFTSFGTDSDLSSVSFTLKTTIPCSNPSSTTHVDYSTTFETFASNVTLPLHWPQTGRPLFLLPPLRFLLPLQALSLFLRFPLPPLFRVCLRFWMPSVVPVSELNRNTSSAHAQPVQPPLRLSSLTFLLPSSLIIPLLIRVSSALFSSHTYKRTHQCHVLLSTSHRMSFFPP
jgi:hypothetical protein